MIVLLTLFILILGIFIAKTLMNVNLMCLLHNSNIG